MKIDWILVGWIIDMILNGVVWLIIVALALPLIDKTDKWTRKAVKLMGSADDFIRNKIKIKRLRFSDSLSSANTSRIERTIVIAINRINFALIAL